MQGVCSLTYEMILFDADDTLYDYPQSEHHALTQALKDNGIDIHPQLLESYQVINKQLWRDFEQGLVEQVRLRTERFARFQIQNELQLGCSVEELSNTYLKYLAEGSFLLDGALEICEHVRARGYRMAIITNGIKEVQMGRIGGSSLANFFEDIIVSEDTGYQKPESGIFDYTFNKLKLLDKKKVLIVGDSLTSDMAGGMNYGIDTCWFNPHHKVNDTGMNLTYEISKLDELMKLLD